MRMHPTVDEDAVGTVVSLDRHRRERERRGDAVPAGDRPRRPGRALAPVPDAAVGVPEGAPTGPPPTVLCDRAAPGTYHAAERADRMLPGARWRPVHGDLLLPPRHRGGPRRERARLEARAAALRLPLVWPEHPVRARGALRVAALADERGRGAAFVQAAARLAWAGGYDLEDPEVLVEAAGAAGLGAAEALAAAADGGRDAPMVDEAGRLRVLGVCELPAVRVGERIVAGEGRLAEAALLARRSTAAARPLPRAT